jgi:hypothetical protein
MRTELDFNQPASEMPTCPYCGEPVELEIDEIGLHEESFIEDCDVCCRPINVHVSRASGKPPEVALSRDDD